MDGSMGRTPGAKMIYPIKRRPAVSREELVVHWFANHMPWVIEQQTRLAEQRKPAALKYIATLFDAHPKYGHAWDGMAQLWFDEPPPAPDEPFGTEPKDSFQQHAEPYVPWATVEYVVMEPGLPVEPLTLNAPFPATRSGFYKVSFLVKANTGTDYDALYAHWLDVHVPNVRSVMGEVGGFGYAVSLSINPLEEPYAGLAELYFPDDSGWERYKAVIKPDGMERWVEAKGTVVLGARTEMIGIP